MKNKINERERERGKIEEADLIAAIASEGQEIDELAIGNGAVLA